MLSRGMAVPVSLFKSRSVPVHAACASAVSELTSFAITAVLTR
jgi:hypothetical protein